MATSVIGALRVNLGLDSAQFEKGAKRVQQPLAAMRQQFLMVAGAAAGLGTALGGFALRAAQDIDKVAKSARRIDATVAGYRALEMAADDAGANISSLADDVQTMNREIAKNSKGAQEALKSLGITAAELGSLDADQKIALIADRVKALGLDSGQASVLLQKLGVRNREMALLVLGGGDALRQARIDVEEYGLALSDIDAAKIEAANDEIAGLADIGAYLGDQLALKIVPNLGNMAKAMTDSLREGGLLRGVLDGLLSVVERLGAYIGVIVTGFGVRYVGALAVAAASTATLSGALLFLRTALIRTGIGALIVGAGELVFQFSRLVTATGSWGAALEALGDLASGVWEGIKTSASSIVPALNAVWESVQAGFYIVLENMTATWRNFLEMLSGVAGFLPGGDFLAGKLNDAAASADASVTEFATAANDALIASGNLKAEASSLASEGFDKARDAAARLAEIVRQGGVNSDAAANSTAGLGDALDQMGNSAGGAKDKTKELTDAQKDLKQSAEQIESSFGNAFTSFVTGAKSAKSAIGELLGNLASMAANAAFKGLFGGSDFFSNIASWFGGGKSFAGGGYTGGGPRSGGLDGQGGFMAMLHPRETVVDHTRLGGNLAGSSGGGAGQMIVRAYSDPGVILEISQGVTREGLKQFSGEPLTQAIRANSADQRVIRT